VIAVATPEEMPVNETMTLADELTRDRLPLDLVIVNALYPARFEDGEIAELNEALSRTRSALARSAMRAALSEHARAATQREQRDRLKERVNGRLVELPYLFAEQVDLPQLELLAGALEAAL
jgi:anion-transporting  ArsA/GET3 family ATPase